MTKIRDNILPVLGPKCTQEDIDSVTEVLKSGWWGKGPKVKEFEEKFAKLVGAKYAVATTSNTHAQDLVIKALGLKNKDIINPTISFLTTAIVPLWNECTTNIVDVDERTLCIDPEDVRRSLKPNTEMVIAVNMAGIPAPIDEIRKFYDGFIIEDCAHSCYTPGAGTKGDIAIWSFQAVKTLPAGDGGMITTNDEAMYTKLKDMTWLGISSTFSRVNNSSGYSWDYDVKELGIKCYMIDLTAALCLSQLSKLEGNLKHRRHIRDEYNKRLHSFATRPPLSDTVQYYTARVDKNIRNDLIQHLASKKIHTSVHFKPIHLFSAMKQDRLYPVADKVWETLISLPVHNNMNDDDIDYVIEHTNNFVSQGI